MDNIESYRKKLPAIEALFAFVLFKETGIEAVEKAYPAQRDFVLENEQKSLTEIKRELFNLI